MSKSVDSTPLMRQYWAIKEKYPGALLLFRVGDFYETFLEDAVKASKVLDIALTKRSNGSAASVALAGFPHHALDVYLPKLVKAGYRVAICDQLEDAKQAKGIVQRGVTELVTPGLSFSEAVLDTRANNYVASIFFDKTLLGMAFLDLSTGEFFVTQGTTDYMQKILHHLGPSEILFNKKQQTLWNNFTQDCFHTYGLEDWIFQFDYAYGLLNDHFGTHSLKGFGISDYSAGIVAAGVILHYLSETEHKAIKHIRSMVRLEFHQYVWLDPFTVRALELLVPQQVGGTALIEILDRTVTPMGARLLKKWLLFPLKEVVVIQERLDIVEYLVKDAPLATLLVNHLKQIGDLERLISKVAVGRVNPREMVALKRALQQVQSIQTVLQTIPFPLLQKMNAQLHGCHALVDRIHQTLQEQPPLLTHQGGLIQPHVNDKLDGLNEIMRTGKDYLVELQKQESQRTNIPSLKVAYNRVFGYYLEVSNAHKNKVPTDWIRKQTLAHAERYSSEALKQYEAQILHAGEEAQLLEQQLYQALVAEAVEYIPQIQENAKYIAQLDCYLSFAKQACEYHYSKPMVDNGTLLHLKNNRHPVIEQRLPIDKTYTPNDMYLDPSSQQIIVITGPNMAGKSALLRQVALTVLMAQMGSFVPASDAQIGVVDKIFTRVGASDNLAQGESTFMMEMTETASIMHNLSDRSLVLMDEIGRGTSTYDGISIAWALVEYLHHHPRYKAKTLFATHYHELNELAKSLPRVKNFNVAVQEIEQKILFLHKLVPGGSQHSFGIHVAQMAGMPSIILERAREVLAHLSQVGGKIHAQVENLQQYQLKLFGPDETLSDLKAFLDGMDIDLLTPVEALLKLNQIKNMVKRFNN
ncbi:DNA mismatch repair protein mutS [Cardinium endosymbiont cEper1 of Encarsia pergandiella]|uniref:DNA mismatch repair protein MutS n=1 Tax=Cardinium endosymbiont of Encarsia pergandiella TaxID=249402 RepID=UPI00027EA2A3|nr:DNA mismatch repair protein MutS [Cardinium endosymbiont of Encarsia pergandiella]CCM10213.1 DNA mismatch repair protein mutS [Cardinium endosymbiont cEper1 of Encarsia pergandiella]